MGVVARAGLVVAAVAAVGYLTDTFAGGSAGAGVTRCVVAGVAPRAVAGYDTGQVGNAAVIVAVGKRMGVPERGRVVAVATAMQESGLRNLDHGDRDSLGLFQQRPSQGWGSPAQVTNPAYASSRFYQGLAGVDGWQLMSVNDAAQAVQRSGVPGAYGQHEPAARTVVAAVGAARCG
jgi:hypothetical protein